MTPTITVAEVKDWYEKTLAEQKGTSSLREDSILLIDVGPRWTESLNGFSLTTNEFLMTPLTLSASQQHSQFKLLTTRQADGSLTGKLAIYTPTPAYHIAKNGKYSVSDFTGTVLYTDLSGKFEYGHYIENGLYKGQAFAKSRDRPNTNTLGVRECTTISYTICIDFDPGQVLRPGCMYTVDVSITTCTGSSTAGSGNGSGGMGSGGGGGAWNTSQPTNLFSTNEIEALRTKFRNANLDDIFYTLELHQGLLKAADSFLEARGWNSLNKPAIESLVNTTGEYAALAGYLTALSIYTDFYNANVNTNTLVSTFVAFAKYHKAGFTAEEFADLYANQSLFTEAYNFLNLNNFNSESIKAAIGVFTIAKKNWTSDQYTTEQLEEIKAAFNQEDDPILGLAIDYFVIDYLTQVAVLKKLHPTWSKYRVAFEASKEALHLALDICGLAPVYGEACDATNGLFYTIQGDGLNASLSFASAIPFAGWAAAGAKLGVKITGVIGTSGRAYRLTYKIVGNVVEFGKDANLRKQLRNILKTPILYQAHHIVPLELVGEPLVQLAAKSKAPFHINEFNNGINMSYLYHNGSHPTYTTEVRLAMDRIYNANMTPQAAQQELQLLIERIRNAINSNPTTNINNIQF